MKMKKYLIITLVMTMFFPIFIIGKERTKAEMDSIATSVLDKVLSKANEARAANGNRVKESMILNIESSATINTQVKGTINSSSPFAVYTFESGKPGYVVVSTDDKLPAVIAFSDKEAFSASNPPLAMLHMLKRYVDRLSEKNSSSDESKKYQTYSEIPLEVEPLLGNIAFNQFSPYNDKCPLMDGERTVTGCLATAMAQLMAYYKYPQKMSGDKIEYTTEKYGLPVSWDCSTTVFDWDNMLDTYVYLIEENPKTTDEQYMTYTDLKLSTTKKQCLELTMLVSISANVLNGDMQLLLADNEGNFIYPVGKKYDITNVNPRAGWGKSEITHIVPNEVPDGFYRLYVGFKHKDSDEWSIMQRAKDSTNIYNSAREECYISISKTGAYYTINEETFVCTNGYYNKVQGDAIATLCAACGATTQMNYGTDGSSTDNSNMAIGLAEYMDYDYNMYKISSAKFSKEGWIESIVQTELSKNRPVYCCGSLEDGGSHAFVIDGYKYIDDIPYFHVNWGWNGQDNGYFLLDNMTTSGGKNFGYGYSLTMGIKPDDGIDQGFVFSASNISVSCADQKLSITVENLINCTIKVFGGDLIIYAIGEDGNEHVLQSNTWDSWKEFAGYGSWTQTISIPSYIESGNYQIVFRTKEKGSSVERDIFTPSFPNVYIENAVTAINEVKITDINSSSSIYDLSGKKLKTANRKQIYIINKKKYNQ